MISKKKFKKLADKHLTAIERPRNEFGRNEIKIHGLDELYEAINYTRCCEAFYCYDNKYCGVKEKCKKQCENCELIEND